MTKVVLHNGTLHADDAFAAAALKLVLPEVEFVRTRDVAVMATADLRVDVGGKSDPNTGDFDHHMKGGAGARENGVPYAAFGLVWKLLGAQIAGSKAAADRVDRVLVQPVDAVDNGVKEKFELRPFTISDAISSFNPTWDAKEQNFDAAFEAAVEFATMILKNVIAEAQGASEADEICVKSVAGAKDARVVVLEQWCPWQETIVSKAPAALYVVFYSAPTKDWKVQAIPTTPDGTDQRKPLPATWAGKSGTDLEAVTGVEGSVFCHPGKFICGAKTEEAAMKLAALAVAA